MFYVFAESLIRFVPESSKIAFSNSDCMIVHSEADIFESVSVRRRRVLDKFVQIYQTNDQLGELETAVFQFLGADYEKFISVENNLACIRLLYDFVRHECTQLLLDFGSGSGLSSSLIQPDLRIVGIESNTVLAKASCDRGLEVSAFPELQDSEFDAGISSYTLHLDIPEMDLHSIARVLKPGGLFAANFHKNWNLTRSLEAFERTESMLSISRHDSPFGTVAVWRRLA